MKSYFLRGGIISITLTLVIRCNGQVKTIQPDRLTRTQGTKEYAQVRCGMQDKNGNLWFGTSGEGVYRYNGKTFTQFTRKEGLSHLSVQCVLQDKNGITWLGTNEGLCRFDGQTIKEEPMGPDGRPSFADLQERTPGPAAKRAILCMLEDKSGKLWLGTSDGVYTFNGKTFSRFPASGVVNKGGLQLKMTQYMLQDRRGNIWFGCGVWDGEGLSCFDGKSLTNFRPNGHGWIRYIVEDKAGTIWFGTRNDGNWRYDGTNYKRFNDKTGIGAPILADHKGNIWFGGEEHDNGYGGKGGVWYYDGKTFRNFTTTDGIGDYSVWSITEDRQGNVWFGTRNMGLYKYDGNKFTAYSD
jgi:ligand-binding sensor domain-containing protein